MGQHFSTYDLYLAATLFALGYEIVELDRGNPRRVSFVFKGQPGLQEVIESYWNNSLVLPAQKLFNAQKSLKSRLYGEVKI